MHSLLNRSAILHCSSTLLTKAHIPTNSIMAIQPPTYKQAQAQLNQFLANGVPDTVKEKAQAAMADELSKLETAQSLLDEVRALGDSAIKIDQAFERVKIDLGAVDQNNYKDKSGNPIPKLQPTWIGYQQV